MKRNSLLVSFLAVVLLFGCDVFLPDVGGLNEQCADNGDCMGDLVCNFGRCEPLAADGEQCDEEQQWNNEILVCEGGLWCVDNECVEAGGEGEPCDSFAGYIYYGGEDTTAGCDEGLYCIGGTCLQAGGEGQLCLNYDESDDEGDCDDGLLCVNGTCAEPLPDTVQQPDSTKVWTRCPVGMQWSGWECTGTVTDLLWSDALWNCPFGFQVPSLDDFIEILADCDASVISHSEYGGECDTCSQSSNCDEMFTDDPTGSDEGWNGDMKSADYWTRDVGKVIGSTQYAFMVDFGGGYNSVDTSPNPSLWYALTLCIKY